MTFFDNHTHTEFSNLRLLDCINRPEKLIDKAVELGLGGIAITDHECLSSHMRVNKYAKKLRETNPDFTIALGNEIYLVKDRSNGQKYYHFILIAKDKIGYRALKQMSSIAWYNIYTDRRMERVPILYSEVAEVMKECKGHVIATTACIGGYLGSEIMLMEECEDVDDWKNAEEHYNNIIFFLDWAIQTFGRENFYLEVSPAKNGEQKLVNNRIQRLAKKFELNVCIGSDSHYMRPEDRWVHKAYLNSKGGEREVDAFYESTYLMSPDECRDLLRLSFDDESFIDELFESSMRMKNSIQFFSLEKHQSIPEVEVKDYPKVVYVEDEKKHPTIKELYMSDNIQERYWVNQCMDKLEELNLLSDERYIDRLEEEARIKKVIGEKLETCMFAYPNTLQHYIDLFWECGSTVGAGRGSACSGLNHYLLGITQLDPIEWDLPFWRYLNDERVELGDIDIDLAPSKLKRIFTEIRKERGELGLVQVCTFGTEGTKSAILTACRGYRSDEYPEGIDVDEAQYLSSLVPVERGFLWSLNDLIHGNPSKDRKPQTQFINAAKQYPGLIDIIAGIEGLICRRGSHASGVILFDEKTIFDTAAIMRTPSGALVTQWDLHDQEAAGSVKYDFLLTSVQDIIIQTIEFLQADNVIEPELNLREVYNKYLHPRVLPQNDKRMWDALANNKVISCFQFDSSVGAQAAKKIKPTSALEMADANGLMRLMTGEKGGEMPIDKYVRYKNNINLWYAEMDRAGLTKEEQRILEPYFLSSYGVPPSQEQLMKMLMDKNICGFTLAEANNARKIVGKKQMDKIPQLQQKVLDQAKSKKLGEYVWKYGAGPQMGYSFSIIHALAYSFVGMQTLYLATNFNPVYWNTACLLVNSGSIESEDDVDESTNYGKIAKAIGEIRSAGIKVSLANINTSSFGFVPDVKSNQILFGLKGLLNIGDDLVNTIIANRPYISPRDFLNRVKPTRQAMISLIKAGAFDEMMDRKLCMGWYLWETCDKKKRITLQNMGGLIKHNLLPEDTEERVMARRVYEFNRYLKAVCKYTATHYKLDERAINFLTEINSDNLIEPNYVINVKSWDKVYQVYMDVFRNWIAEDKDKILQNLNERIFLEDWQKYAKSGNISSWEMEVMCFYYHEHELNHINYPKYGLSNFFDLPEEPIVDRSFVKNGKEINLFKLHKICGTCIAKNKTKGTATLLTPDGVVEVKFRKEYFSLFDKQISERGADGVKHVVEKSWFNRGSMIIVQGIRNGDAFIPKKYNSSGGHQLYKIDEVYPNGDILIRSTRYQGELEDE